MTDTQSTNSRIVLASRPVGAPTQDNFRLETVTKPVPANGEVLLRSVYLSLDPYMRGRMSDAKSYADPVAVNDVMVGATVCQVAESNNPEFEIGEWVLAYTGWQGYCVSDGEGLLKLGKQPAAPSYALGIMGMPGFTAYMGLLDIGQPKPGDTLVVAAATGPVGATVGQIGKLKGCRVVGVAGGEEKCRYVKEVLALMNVLITRQTISSNSYRLCVATVLMSISKMSVAKCLMRYYRCSTLGPVYRYAV